MKNLSFIGFVALASLAGLASASTSVRDAGLKGDGLADDTAALQKLLDSGEKTVEFTKGVYRFGTVAVGSDAVIRFSPDAEIVPVREKLVALETVTAGNRERKVERKQPLFRVHGNNVRFEGLHFDFAAGATEKDASPVERLIGADSSTNLMVSGFVITSSTNRPLARGQSRIVVRAEDCSGVTVENCDVTGVNQLVWTEYTENLVVRGNRQIGGASMTTFQNGGQCLRHHDNWSRNVGYQCVWRGGSPDPSRKAPRVPLGTADTVHRGSREGDPDFVPHTAGIYDVFVSNNYAEYGTVLCWGNKSRQTVIDGNIARFMFDYSYGTEGGENVIFSNNISVNSAVAGFMSLYWGEKVLIMGNICLVRHEEFDPRFCTRDRGLYLGQFIRLHHGPQNKEDRYGAGSVEISGNLFINELADRPSGISIEGGRDVRIANNKIINGLVRKSDELVFVKPGEKDTADEFVSGAEKIGEDAVAERRIGVNLSKVTVSGNEFILRQPGDKPQVLIDGTVSHALIKDNIFRKEESTARISEEDKVFEKTPARFQLYAVDERGARDVRNAEPAVAIGFNPRTDLTTVVSGNIIEGWTTPISTNNVKTKLTAVIDGNITL